MKALVAGFSVGREMWGKLKSKMLGRESISKALTLEFSEIPEPPIISSQWVKIRTVMSGVSDFEEAMALFSDPSPYGPSLSFPFVPGSENLGIVTEKGSSVQCVDAGDRVVVNPILSCVAREIEPLCPLCKQGRPDSCLNFSEGVISPGMMIGACKDSSGGWADSFIAHQSQVRLIPHEIESDQAVMIMEFTRALRAALQRPPAPDETVLIVGGGSLGLLTLISLRTLGHENRIIIVAHSQAEAEMAEAIGGAQIVISGGPGASYEKVASMLGSTVRYPEAGRVSMQGGADLVYETTGLAACMEDGIAFTAEGKRFVSMALRESWGFSASQMWLKKVIAQASSFSGLESINGELMETFDLALRLTQEHDIKLNRLISHRFGLDQFKEAFDVLAARDQNKALKVIFQHVV